MTIKIDRFYGNLRIITPESKYYTNPVSTSVFSKSKDNPLHRELVLQARKERSVLLKNRAKAQETTIFNYEPGGTNIALTWRILGIITLPSDMDREWVLSTYGSFNYTKGI